MAKDRLHMPSSQGGLVRYFDDEYTSKFIIKPQHVLFIGIGIIVAVVLLHIFW